MTDAPAPHRARASLFPMVASAAVVALALLGVGGWYAYRHLTFWDRGHPIAQLTPVDDESAILRQDDDPGGRVRVARVDGNGAERWATVVTLAPGSPESQMLAAPVPVATTVIVGTQVGLSLDDGHELWRDARPERAPGCRSWFVDDGLLLVRCDTDVLAIDPATGVERWRVPFARGSFRYFGDGPDTIVLDHEDQPTPAVRVRLSDGTTTPLASRVCVTNGFLLSLEPKRVSVEPIADASARKSADADIPDLPAPSCGLRPDSFIVGRGTMKGAELYAIERETLALKWSLRVPVKLASSIGCLEGDAFDLDLDAPLPRHLPLRVGGGVYLVDLDDGSVQAQRDVAVTSWHCGTGVSVHAGRAYQVGQGELAVFDPASASPRATTVDTTWFRRPAFSASFVWLLSGGRVGRLKSDDLSPAPGSEWLAPKRTTGAWGRKP